MGDAGQRLDSSGCMVCGDDNPHGMQLQYRPNGSDGTRACGAIPARFAGFDDIAHGGAVGAVLDDAMWWAIYWTTGAHTMTAELQVRYVHPVPVDTELEVTGCLDRQRGRMFWASATVCTAAGDGEILAQAEGKFLTTPARDAE